MRLPSIREPEESNSMSAMTDVVFLLLIFFIVTMSGYNALVSLLSALAKHNLKNVKLLKI